MRKILTHGQISGLTDRSIEGKKTWDDSNNADRLRPVSIQVRLLADGAAYGDVITLSDGNNWSYTYMVRSSGKEEWTVYFIHGTGDHECKRIYRKHQRVRNRIH